MSKRFLYSAGKNVWYGSSIPYICLTSIRVLNVHSIFIFNLAIQDISLETIILTINVHDHDHDDIWSFAQVCTWISKYYIIKYTIIQIDKHTFTLYFLYVCLFTFSLTCAVPCIQGQIWGPFNTQQSKHTLCTVINKTGEITTAIMCSNNGITIPKMLELLLVTSMQRLVCGIITLLENIYSEVTYLALGQSSILARYARGRGQILHSLFT